MVSTSELSSGNSGSFPGKAKYLFAFHFLTMWTFCSKLIGGRGRRPNFVTFVVWDALIIGGVGGGGVERKVLFRAGCCCFQG